MKIKTIINLHKLLTFLVVLGLMFLYKNFTFAAYIYLALHGTYGLMWLIKDAIYSDKKWEEEIPIHIGIITFIILGLYWVAAPKNLDKIGHYQKMTPILSSLR